MFQLNKKLVILTLASSLAFSGVVFAKAKPAHAGKDKANAEQHMQKIKDKGNKKNTQIKERLEDSGDGERSEVAERELEDRLEFSEMRKRHRAEMDALRANENLSGKERADEMKALRELQREEAKTVRDFQKDEKREFMQDRKESRGDKNKADKERDRAKDRRADAEERRREIMQRQGETVDKDKKKKNRDRMIPDKVQQGAEQAEENADNGAAADKELTDKAKDATAKKKKRAWWKFWGD